MTYDIFQCQAIFISISVQLIFNKYHVTIKGDSICHLNVLFHWQMLINRIVFTPYLNKSNFNLLHEWILPEKKLCRGNLSDW